MCILYSHALVVSCMFLYLDFSGIACPVFWIGPKPRSRKKTTHNRRQAWEDPNHFIGEELASPASWLSAMASLQRDSPCRERQGHGCWTRPPKSPSFRFHGHWSWSRSPLCPQVDSEQHFLGPLAVYLYLVVGRHFIPKFGRTWVQTPYVDLLDGMKAVWAIAFFCVFACRESQIVHFKSQRVSRSDIST